ncbi:YrdB family protein [soil metagenome]
MRERSMRDLNLAFRFILELVVLAALAVWGFSVSGELLVQLALGIGAPAVVIAVWATFVAPRAERRLEDPARLILEVVVFGSGVLALIAAGHVVPGILLAVATAISLALMIVWGQRGY